MYVNMLHVRLKQLSHRRDHRFLLRRHPTLYLVSASLAELFSASELCLHWPYLFCYHMQLSALLHEGLSKSSSVPELLYLLAASTSCSALLWRQTRQPPEPC